MPTLQKVSTLNRANMGVTEQIQQTPLPDISNVGKEAAIYSEAIGGALKAFAAYDEIDQENQLATARSKMFVVNENNKAAFDKTESKDYKSILENSEKLIKESQAPIYAGVTNPRARARLEAEMVEKNTLLARYHKDVAWEKEVDHEKAITIKQMEEISKTVSKDNIGDMYNTVDALVNAKVLKGYFKEEEGELLKDKFTASTFLMYVSKLGTPEEQIAELNSPAAVKNINESVRSEALLTAEKALFEKTLSISILNNVQKSKTAAQVLNNVIRDKSIPLEQQAEARKKALEQYNLGRAAVNEVQEAIYQTIAKDVFADPSTLDANKATAEYKGLTVEQQKAIEQAAELSKSQASDPATHSYAVELIKNGEYDKAAKFVTGNRQLNDAHETSLLNDIENRRAPKSVEYQSLVEGEFGKPKTDIAAQRQTRRVESLVRWREQFVNENKREPTKEELDGRVLDLGGRYNEGMLDWGGDNLYIADLPYEEHGKAIEEMKKAKLKDDYEEYYEGVEEIQGSYFKSLSSYEVKDHIDLYIADPELYQDAADLMKEKGGSFKNAYGYIKTIRNKRNQ